MKSILGSYLISILGLLFLWGLVLDFIFLAKRKYAAEKVGVGDAFWGWRDAAAVVLFFVLFEFVLEGMSHFIFKTFVISPQERGRIAFFANSGLEVATVLFLCFLLGRRYGLKWKTLGLALISHHISATSADSASSLRADSVGHAQHAVKYASHGLGRLPRIQRRTQAFLATKSDEKCGLEKPFSFSTAKEGVLAYCGALPPLVGVGLATQFLGRIWKIPLKPQVPLQILQGETSIAAWAVMGFVIVILVPFLEEIFFRGFLYALLRKSFGMGKAMVLNSLLFSSLHFSFLAFLPIFCIGLFLAYLYEKTGSLFAPMVFHALNNTVAVLLVVFLMK
ncbi:MAG: CPBP family intramembrane metalloprotease [Chlamydiae bacterium]|nr:CPBP family intramembrane metalloprotease [Chlamydiota bacterium]MBI3267340.1 CPBP family intramembrane metalloprotease [Chlamydiota bacterium]